MGICLYTVHASLFQSNGSLMSSPIFSAAGYFVNSRASPLCVSHSNGTCDSFWLSKPTTIIISLSIALTLTFHLHMQDQQPEIESFLLGPLTCPRLFTG
jgi:hypothetical protein